MHTKTSREGREGLLLNKVVEGEIAHIDFGIVAFSVGVDGSTRGDLSLRMLEGGIGAIVGTVELQMSEGRKSIGKMESLCQIGGKQRTNTLRGL